MSSSPPTLAVFPSVETATEEPWPAPGGGLRTPVPTNFCCWLHTPPERVYTHAASALRPPTMAVFPSPESETAAGFVKSVPTSSACWLHTSPKRVNIHAALGGSTLEVW